MVIENKPGCVEATTRIVGDKWTPLLLCALALKPLRFCELQKETGSINPRTLSARLSNLEENGIIMKSRRQTNTPSQCIEYRLTPKGADLIPILRSMASWGERYGLSEPTTRQAAAA